MTPGILFLIVGPSGAGKDTLIDGARAALKDDGRFIFARRVITRPADSGGESHEAVTEEEFAARERSGKFLMTWRAHGLAYGLTRDLEDDLEAGRHVVANVSRATLAAFVGRFPDACIVEITAPPEVLSRRLAARGREDATDIAERLTRDAPEFPPGAQVRSVVNDGTVDEGIARLLHVLNKATVPAC